jgi:hypothetical protein
LALTAFPEGQALLLGPTAAAVAAVAAAKPASPLFLTARPAAFLQRAPARPADWVERVETVAVHQPPRAAPAATVGAVGTAVLGLPSPIAAASTSGEASPEAAAASAARAVGRLT